MDEAQAFWFGAVADGKVDPSSYSARLTGTFVPEASGLHRIGVFAAGLARVHLDGKLVADAWTDWKPGRTFFEEGCDEVVGLADLEAGRAHEIVIDFATKPSRNLTFAAFRVGIGKPLGRAEISAAAEAAASAETALVFVGRNGEWDTEGSDLLDISLPGRQDELVFAVAAANPKTDRRSANRRASGDALARRRRGGAPGLVSRSGGRQRHRRRCLRRRRAGRPPAADVSRALGRQSDRRARSGGLPGPRRQGPLCGGTLRRLPPLRPRRHRAALPFRTWAELYALRTHGSWLPTPMHSRNRVASCFAPVCAIPEHVQGQRSCRSTSTIEVVRASVRKGSSRRSPRYISRRVRCGPFRWS